LGVVPLLFFSDFSCGADIPSGVHSLLTFFLFCSRSGRRYPLQQRGAGGGFFFLVLTFSPAGKGDGRAGHHFFLFLLSFGGGDFPFFFFFYNRKEAAAFSFLPQDFGFLPNRKVMAISLFERLISPSFLFRGGCLRKNFFFFFFFPPTLKIATV